MGLIKEPKNIDLSTKSEPWTEQELYDFRKIMQDIKAKNAKHKKRPFLLKVRKTQSAWQIYFGVPGNLVAFAGKLSFQRGGEVMFLL